MKACGIVVEYNPFHNGHLYHINEAKRVTKCDCLIAIMSGNFVQRGEPAIIPKWERTQMALNNGCDIVIELPYAFATQKAETFAYGAVKLLDELLCDTLIFGSEDGNIQPFIETVNFLDKNKTEIDSHMKILMKDGHTYAKAYSLAIEQLPSKPKLDLTKPNNILGLEYMKAAKKMQSTITVDTILRIQAGYHDEQVNESSIASATAIRKLLKNNRAELYRVMPKENVDILLDFYDKYQFYPTWEQFFPMLKYKIMSSTPEQLRSIYEVEEGIEYRLIEKIKKATSFENFIELIKTKRYTQVKLQRMCLHILLNVPKEILKKPEPRYIRLLGMTETGQAYLREVKRKLSIPLLAKASASNDPSLYLDIHANTIYSLAFPLDIQSQLQQKEYSQIPIQIK